MFLQYSWQVLLNGDHIQNLQVWRGGLFRDRDDDIFAGAGDSIKK